MKTKSENDEFANRLDHATKNCSPRQRNTVRRKLKKTVSGMGSTPEEVLQALLESNDPEAANKNGSGSRPAAPAPAPPQTEDKRGIFKRMLIKLGLST